MCQYLARDGFIDVDWTLCHLGSMATGGAALVISEATAVSPAARITPGCAGLWSDEQIAGWTRVNQFLQSKRAVTGIQLSHAGRKASANVPWVRQGASLGPGEQPWTALAPSALRFGGVLTHVPQEMTRGQIEEAIEQFKKAAIRAIKAGFQLIELHFAHGYLMHSFLSPLANRRTDEYGGSFENRIRFSVEVVKEVRAAMPDAMPLFVRISATEYNDNGWNINDSVALASVYRNLGVDVIDCSSSHVAGSDVVSDSRRVPQTPCFQVPLAEQIKREAGIRTAAVGLITTGRDAEAIVQNDQADIVLAARQFMRDPYFAFHAGIELGLESPAQSLLPHQQSYRL